MKVTTTHTTTISVEPGDKVRDLAQVLNDMPNGAEIRCSSGIVGWPGSHITIDHASLKG
ncbi:hypothetical protein I5H03_gp049 [Mycobacterium phage Nibb]|uniref:Uncharacterized protein n=1 Tax=Mycobacterium phage Nibb TaxID=2510585 RepID=A0A411B5I1_9CAUD|nr:hypothetical protein I5H03_gp049 [Mycobacterium phage Nibb]QAX95597.1 hypothetical protein SEA_NIBB_58 [Mycobacterium phage Nibb]